MDSKMKNLLKGFGAALSNVITKILIPWYIFRSILQNAETTFIDLGYTEAKVDIIIFWIVAMGSITASLSFTKASSPKYSNRKAIFEIILIFANAIYLYLYRFSGALDIAVSLDLGFVFAIFSLNFETMVYISMGVIGLNLIIGLYDLIISFTTIEEEL
ncbi:hypothetical protein DSAG12_02542 [Promethearchaeum syntrophicum]|uniref:Uncharacterized protein n=1 Tax=Promethearchaeum syntrophicum TaxID=2594042 RepID=A0A5B9DC66_9ARCH|nr:hypothetical protein [Candidatus Prometheoarchaeum syntrophicum]QEE16712.1 hypothetical protein DSAG12_02542 [Candidatus Prometheoarchaeum syntrophicum]